MENEGSHLMLRRDVLKSILAFAALPSTAAAQQEPGLRLGQPQPFRAEDVAERAREMAKTAYAPRATVPESWQNLTYDQYRKIWFDGRNALWEGTNTPQRVDVFPPGLYFPQPVEIHVVEGGTDRLLQFDMEVFDTTDKFPDVEIDETLGYSGVRLRADLRNNQIFQEYAVFQGASYFRGIGTGQTYGLSARGLALKTGDPMGEEFPDFTAFWIETPADTDTNVIVHALLDSASCTGAYRFDISHGETLRMDVSATVFARQDMTHVGIAPLTSMFLFDDTMRQRFSDFRPAVHDSDGLLIHNGAGEVIWRPLANPLNLQISAFSDTDPKGFGLIQRARSFSDFADLEALYHNRPSVWITPKSEWGRGSVTLVEIPADLEIYDNIVAYWRPAGTVRAGSERPLEYTLAWGADPAPSDMGLAPVVNTAIGGRPEGGNIVAIDFAVVSDVPEDLSEIEILVRSNAGTTTPGLVQRNPDTGGPRLAFTFDPEENDLIEFRAQLRLNGAPLSEVWLYRWTRS